MRTALHYLFLTAIVLITFGPVNHFYFLNFDDPTYVVNNPWINSGLTEKNIIWAFTSEHGGHWHPLTWISHMMDVELFGLSPGAHHLVNVAFHLLNTFLVYLLVIRIVRHQEYALFGAALFAIHPMRIESVVWISERKDVLSLFFSLLAVHLYFLYANKPTVLKYFGVATLLTLALLAKPMAVVVPLLLILFDHWPLKRKAFFEKVPLLALCVLGSIATLWAQNHAGAISPLTTVPFDARVSTSLVGCIAYLGKFFWPTGIGIFYPLIAYPPGVAAGAALLLIILSVLAWRERANQPYLFFGWCWFIVSLLPVIGIISVGGQTFADRWTYLPHIGLIIALSAWLKNKSLSLRLTRSIGMTSIAALLIITSLHLPNWKDSESIFRHTLTVSPNNFMAHTNLGSILSSEERWEEAAYHFEEAYRLNPKYPEAINNLGLLRAHQGNYSEAASYFDRALQIRPNLMQARANFNLATQLLNSQQFNSNNFHSTQCQNKGTL